MIDETTTELSFIDFQCPHCGGDVSFPQDFAGSAQECPSCTDTVIVPEDGNKPGRKLPFPVATPRLILRRLRGTDWKDLMECRPGLLEEVEVIRWLDSDANVKFTTAGQPFFLGLEMAQGGKLVGFLSLNIHDPQRLQAMVDITINPNYQRQGIASEALTEALKFCFKDIKLHRISAHCDLRNVAGCRLFEKAGMRREGEFRKDRQINGEWTDTVWFARLREEYLAAAQ